MRSGAWCSNSDGLGCWGHLLSGKSYVNADRSETMQNGFEDALRLYEVRSQE